MITIEKLRERLYAPRKRRSGWIRRIDWIKWAGSPTAWLALSLSCVTLYFTFLKDTDDIRVVVGDLPRVFLDNKSGALGILAPQQRLVFINSGNREAAITRISLRVGPLPKDAKAQCPDVFSSSWAHYKFNSFVIKPEQVYPLSLNKMDLSMDGVINVKDRNAIILSSAGVSIRRSSYVGVCLQFGVITPDNVPKGDPVVLLYATSGLPSLDDPSLQNGVVTVSYSKVLALGVPVSLIDHYGTIF